MKKPPRDRVERETFIHASIEAAFAALTDPALFPTWGPERVDGVIAVGERPILDFGASGKTAVYVVALDPPRYFAYRWAQGASDPVILLGDPLAAPNTLVEFHLEERDGGTRVRVVESGIDQLPGVTETNLDEALEGMGKGWRLMLDGLPRHFTFAGGDRVESEVVIAAPAERVHAALRAPRDWWMFAPELDVDAPDDRGVTYRRRHDDGSTTVTELRLDEVDGKTRVRMSETGFASLAAAKRAHQHGSVILGMLAMHLA